MPRLETLTASSSEEETLQLIGRDGACILADAMDSKLQAAVREDLDPIVKQTQYGRDDFTGTKTQRIGALVARSPSCRVLVTNEKILSLARQFLRPFTKKIQTSATQAINIHPGELQ